ncbi:hypothetical protein N7471_008362 [Penicillium samsonianum]|uniref:uncharacterized protein n=1 Tax=Penicillium samsonianum TaxID=1882272 RepID=UPI002547C2BC|nr:uncharacterized protein N7471_008362 [Penicillium samsonianum]KAJ6133147.1 hypothetical protein N7471_008362 [Penicillium samsonianum]
MSLPQTYNDNQLIQLYINNIKTRTREDRVDHVWTQILRFYWPITANYGIEREPYAAENARTKADVVLTTMSMNKIVKCVFVECKRHNADIENSDWDSSKAQLERFIRRWEERSPTQVIYGLLCIGHSVRFYYMPQFKDKLVDFKTKDLTLSIQDNATEVDMILREIRELIAIEYHV